MILAMLPRSLPLATVSHLFERIQCSFRPWTKITKWATKPRVLDSPFLVQGFKHHSCLFGFSKWTQITTETDHGWRRRRQCLGNIIRKLSSVAFIFLVFRCFLCPGVLSVRSCHDGTETAIFEQRASSFLGLFNCFLSLSQSVLSSSSSSSTTHHHPHSIS
jgi:hypothetical protein